MYLHIIAQWKKSEDLEIYETDYVSPSQLQETCDIRQPFLFRFREQAKPYYSKLSTNLSKNDTIDVNIKDTREYWSIGQLTTPETVALPLHSARKLLETDTSGKYVSEQNDEFLEESGLDATMATMDWAFRPQFTIATKYDITFGSAGATTPLRYHTHSRMFLAPVTGKIHVKLTPWKSAKYLHGIKDFDTYEFRSPVNVYSPQSQYVSDMERLRCIDIEVSAGTVLYIPPYWWYSLKFSSDTNTIVGGFVYNTVINALANIPDWSMYFLQQNNITRKIARPAVQSPSTVVAMDSKPADEIIDEVVTQPVVPIKKEELPEKVIITNAGIYEV